MVRSFASLVLALAVVGTALAADTKYKLDGDNTKVTFVGTKKDGKHDGGFKKLSGTITITDGDIKTTKIEVEIDTTSLFSDDEKLTAHLKSPDFFGVKENPKATFVSKEILPSTTKTVVKGELTLNGKKKPASLLVDMAEKDGEFTLDGFDWIERSEFGMTYGQGKIDEKVKVTIKIKAKK